MGVIDAPLFCFACASRKLCWFLRLFSSELGRLRRPAFLTGSVLLHNHGKGWSASVLILVAEEGRVSGTGSQVSSDAGHLCNHLSQKISVNALTRRSIRNQQCSWGGYLKSKLKCRVK